MDKLKLVVISSLFFALLSVSVDGSAGNTGSCDTCKNSVENAIGYLNKTSTQQEIQKFFDDFCSSLNFVEAIVNPNTLCQSLGMCNNMLPITKLVQAKSLQEHDKTSAKLQSRQSGECDTCALVINVVDQLLGNNATENQILHTIDQVCNIFPDDTKVTCKGFMDNYGAALLRMLLNRTPPKEICTLLGLCSSTKPNLKETVDISGLCTVCEIAVQYIDSMLTQNATEQEIISTLDKVCNFLPGSLASDCDTFVKKYAPAVIALLASEISNPKEVCAFLGLCSNSSALAVDTVTNICKKGPKIWCLSTNISKLCKVEAFCKMRNLDI